MEEAEDAILLDMIGEPGVDIFDLFGIKDEEDFSYIIGDGELFEILNEKVSDLIMKQDTELMNDESEFGFEEIFQYLVEGAARMMKDEAELKFIDRDAESALADAYIASQLNPNLPGIQQQIAAYKVHVAASVEIQIDHGNNTKDWYAILGITDEDDDLVDIETIKKRYKRMALMVHPDKNESVAAKTAIKHVNNAMDSLLQPDIKIFLDRIRMERKQSSLSSVASWPSLSNPNEKQFKKSHAPPSSWSSLFDPERMKQEKSSSLFKPKRKTGMCDNSQGNKEVKFKCGYSKSRFYCQKEADYSSDEEDTYDDDDCDEYDETRICPHCSATCEVEIEGRRILSIITCKTCKKMFFRDYSI